MYIKDNQTGTSTTRIDHVGFVGLVLWTGENVHLYFIADLEIHKQIVLVDIE